MNNDENKENIEKGQENKKESWFKNVGLNTQPTCFSLDDNYRNKHNIVYFYRKEILKAA